jgi:hypothetical protein
VSTSDCEHYRGLLALDAIGALPRDERGSLDDHVARCASCGHERDELARAARVLPVADPDHLDEHRMPHRLEVAVLGRLDADARHGRRVRQMRVGGVVLGAAAAVIGALAIVVTLTAAPAASRTLALAGRPGVTASVRLTAQEWGTAVQIDEQGQPGGQVMWVSMRTTDGRWWPTGTYTTVTGGQLTVDMACALASHDIAGVWVRDAAGRTVLRGYVAGADGEAPGA